ncbi:MAG: hypothetical protein AB8B63_05495 [Granulosicoccus sp.]
MVKQLNQRSNQLIDGNKRRMLKWFSATPLAAVPLSGMAAFSNTLMNSPVPARGQQTILDAEIVDTGSLSDNTLLLHNAGPHDIVINQFIGGNVVFNNRLVDIMSLVKDRPLVIAAGGTKSCRIDVWSLMAAPEMAYVYADHAVDYASDGKCVVSLGMYLFDDNAVVYARQPETQAAFA